MVVVHHFARESDVAVGQRLDGVHDLLFNKAAHLQHLRADCFQLGVKLLEGMFGHGRLRGERGCL